MDEARRFLRYVIPGTVFLTQTLLIVWILEPSVAYDIVNAISGKSSVSAGIAALFVSGGAGFILSILHHSLHWYAWRDVSSFAPFVASLGDRKLIKWQKGNNDRESKTPK